MASDPCWGADIQFVQEVEKRACLYDMKSRDYRNHHWRLRAWEEIAQTLNMTVTSCMGRWKTIRDRYVRIYRRSGSGTDDIIEDPGWMVCRHLSFLNPSIKPRSTSGNFREINASLPSGQPSRFHPYVIEKADLEEHEEDLEQTSMDYLTCTEASPSTAPTPHNDASVTRSSPALVQSTEMSVIPGKRRNIQQSNFDKVIEALKVPITVPAEMMQETDPNELFFRSLIPQVSAASPETMRRIHIRVLQVIQEEMGKYKTNQ